MSVKTSEQAKKEARAQAKANTPHAPDAAKLRPQLQEELRSIEARLVAQGKNDSELDRKKWLRFYLAPNRTEEELDTILEAQPNLAQWLTGKTLSDSTATEEPPGDAALKKRYELIQPKKLADASRTLPPELIEGILYQSRRMLVTGASKARKSWLLHQIAFCIANGLKFLDRFSTAASELLYVNFELLEATSALRFDAIAKALGTGSQDNISILSVSDHLDLVGSDFSRYLALIAEELGRKGVVLDPMWRILGDYEENSNTEIRQALVPLVRFAREARASVIGAHHHTKGSPVGKEAIDRSSGAAAWHRDPAVILTMTPHKIADAFTFDIITNDFPPVDPFVVRFTHPIFVIDLDLDPQDLKQPPGTRESLDHTAEKMLAVLRATDEEGGLPFTRWLKACGVKKRTFVRKLTQLTKPHGPVIKNIAEGKYMLSVAYAQEWANNEELES